MTRKKTAPADQKALADAAPETPAPSLRDRIAAMGGVPAYEAPTAPAKPKRVRMRNTKPGNGQVGGIANPLEKDVPAWENRGWVRD